mgnify:FL=1
MATLGEELLRKLVPLVVWVSPEFGGEPLGLPAIKTIEVSDLLRASTPSSRSFF